MDRLEFQREKTITYTELGIVADVKEGVAYLVSNADAVFLALILVSALSIAYFRSPYRVRKLEELKRLQENNTKLTQNNSEAIQKVSLNMRAIDQVVNKVERLQEIMREVGEQNEEITREIREIKEDLKDLQNLITVKRFNR